MEYILSQTNPIHTLMSYLFTIYFNNVANLAFKFSNKLLYSSLPCVLHALCCLRAVGDKICASKHTVPNGWIMIIDTEDRIRKVIEDTVSLRVHLSGKVKG